MCSADAPYDSAKRKLDSITQDTAKPGSTVLFTPAEANAWARGELPRLVPQGVRNLRLDFGSAVVTGTAVVDFQKVRNAQGLMARMLQGERPVRAVARVVSSSGRATVHLTRVEISQAAASGTLLEFLIQNFVQPVYPAAKINEPIELGNRVDRIDIRPTGVYVFIKK
jgi:hypothetical protein